MNNPLTEEIAAVAARLVVESGLEYGPAKHKAARTLTRAGKSARPLLPSNEQVEEAVREHLALFCADSQPHELQALRRVAEAWMGRLAEFRPHLSGAAWRGTATRQSAVHIDLYCDDAKAAEIALLNLGVPYDVQALDSNAGDPLDVLTVSSPCPALGEPVTVHLIVRDHDELRGALKPDAQGRTWRGDLGALRQRMAESMGIPKALGPAGSADASSPPAMTP